MNIENPLVSVIIPTYNRASLLERSLKSVLNQTYGNLEVIVVDDASVDNTEEVVASQNDERTRYIRHETNQGGSAARNTGIKKARGALIAFQDSDDEWHPEKLEKQVRVLTGTSSKTGVSFTGFWRIFEDGREHIPGSRHEKLEGDIFRELLKENFITTQAAVVKKECFEKVGGFDETLPRYQDWDLFLRIARFYEFRYIPEPLVTAYFTEGSISSNQQALRQASEIFIQKYREDYVEDKDLYASKLLSLSYRYLHEGDLSNSRRYLAKALKENKRPGLLLALFVSMFGLEATKRYWDMMNRAQS